MAINYNKCSDCGSIQFRQVYGDITCIGCGLVKEAHVLVDQVTYGDVGDLVQNFEINPMKKIKIGGQKINTIVRPVESESDATNTISFEDFKQVQQTLQLSHETLGLARDILDKALKVQGIRVRGRDRRLLFVAVAFYYACKHLPGGGKTKEEICCCLGFSSKGFGRVCTEIRTALCEIGHVEDSVLKDTKIDDLVNRHISLVLNTKDLNTKDLKTNDLKNNVRSTIYKLYAKVKPFETNLACAPHILVTTLLFMAMKFLKVQITLKTVALACGTCVATIIQYESMIKDLLLST